MPKPEAMKLLVFADGDVGAQVVNHILATGDRIGALVLNSRAETDATKALSEDALQNDVETVVRSDDLYKPEVVERMRRMNPDLGILAWWPYIVRDPVLSLPSTGFLNFHPSSLPYNRGKHPNFWNLVEEVPFGVSLHWVDSEVDHGDLAFQAQIEKSWEDTGETLYLKAKSEIVRLFEENYALIRKGTIPRIPQDHARATAHRAAELDPASKLELDQQYTARDLLNRLRARTFPPHPACWFQDGSNRYEVRVEITKSGKKNEN